MWASLSSRSESLTLRHSAPRPAREAEALQQARPGHCPSLGPSAAGPAGWSRGFSCESASSCSTPVTLADPDSERLLCGLGEVGGAGWPCLPLTLVLSLHSSWGCSCPSACAGTSILKTTARSPSTEAAAVPHLPARPPASGLLRVSRLHSRLTSPLTPPCPSCAGWRGGAFWGQDPSPYLSASRLEPQLFVAPLLIARWDSLSHPERRRPRHPCTGGLGLELPWELCIWDGEKYIQHWGGGFG